MRCFLPIALLCLSPTVRASAPALDTSAEIASFVGDRDALLLRPESTREAYAGVIEAASARLDVSAWPAGPLATAALEGMFDTGPAREAALARASELGRGAGAEGCLGNVARLRLAGARTVFSSPAPEAQGALVNAVMDHPALAETWNSGFSSLIATALISTGSPTALGPWAERIKSLTLTLPPSVIRDESYRLDRIALLLTLSARDGEWVHSTVWSLAEMTSAALEGAQGAERQRRDLASLEAWLEARQVTDYYQADPREQSEGGVEGIAARNADTFGRLLRYLWLGLRTATAANSAVKIEFSTLLPQYDTLLPQGRSSRRKAGETRFAATDGVWAPNGLVRAFGPARASDSLGRASANGLAYSPATQEGFVTNPEASTGIFRVRAGAVTIGDDATRIDDGRLDLKILGVPVVSAWSSRSEANDEGKFTARGVKVGLFGTKLLGVGNLDFSAKDEPKAPQPKRPSFSDWLDVPGLSFFEGGLSVNYRNAERYFDRWTAHLRYDLNLAAKDHLKLGLNYDLLGNTDDTQVFYSVPSLREGFLGSFFFTALNTRVLRENLQLRERKLFAGFGYTANQFYNDEDGNLQMVDIPLFAAVQGVSPLGKYLGAAGQAGFESVSDTAQGTASRFFANGAVGPPLLDLGSGLGLFLRADGAVYAASDSHYGWVRGNVGLTALLVPQLRVSAAYYSSTQSGEPRFEYDRLEVRTGYSIRADSVINNWTLTALGQYDATNNKWNRFQALVGYRQGIVEPYIGVDGLYRTVNFGLKMFPGATADTFARREVVGITTTP